MNCLCILAINEKRVLNSTTTIMSVLCVCDGCEDLKFKPSNFQVSNVVVVTMTYNRSLEFIPFHWNFVSFG